jgi:hypothetical protein
MLAPHGEAIRLWLDILRDPAHHGRIGWTWVTTADAAIAMLATGRVIEASLDHDLDIEATMGYPPREKTGHDVVRWMQAHDVYPRDGVHVHSLNTVGRARMEATLAAMRRRHASSHPAR